MPGVAQTTDLVIDVVLNTAQLARGVSQIHSNFASAQKNIGAGLGGLLGTAGSAGASIAMWAAQTTGISTYASNFALSAAVGAGVPGADTFRSVGNVFNGLNTGFGGYSGITNQFAAAGAPLSADVKKQLAGAYQQRSIAVEKDENESTDIYHQISKGVRTGSYFGDRLGNAFGDTFYDSILKGAKRGLSDALGQGGDESRQSKSHR